MKFEFPVMIQNILNKLNLAGFESYVVGGAIRDMILGQIPKDYDITTNALPEDIVKIFENDDDFMVSDINAKSYHVVSVNGVEITTFRQDVYENGELKETIPVSLLVTDLARRDFTINSMAVALGGVLLDPFGGKNDLFNGIIKFVGDPQKRMKEDPLRILRAGRFLAKINGKMQPETYLAIHDMVDDLVPGIAPERIRLEMLKAMEAETPSKFFYFLRSVTALKYILPSINETSIVKGGKQHREGVFDHCMMTGDFIRKEFSGKSKEYPLLPLAGYLHDIGKCNPVFKNGEIHFYGHEKTGAEIVEKELSDLKFKNKEIKYISGMISCHMQGGTKMSPKSTRKLLAKLNDLGLDYKDWIMLRVADRASNKAQEPYTPRKISKLYKKFEHELNPSTPSGRPALSHKDLAMSGTKIQELLNIGPSPLVGVILNYLMDKVLDNPELNTPEELTKLIIGVKPRPKK